MGIRCADHVTLLYQQMLALNSPTGGGRSVNIVRSRTKATEFEQWASTALYMTYYSAHFCHQNSPRDGSSERHMVSSESKRVADQRTEVLSLFCALDPFQNGNIYGPLLRNSVFRCMQ